MMKTLPFLAAAALVATPALAQDEVEQVELTPRQLADRFEAALVAGDYRELPLTEDFTYTENGARLDPWDGMWRTTTALAGDPFYPELDLRGTVAQGDRVVRIVEVLENTVHGVLVYELATRDGLIESIDVLPIREEFGGDRGGTLTLLQPMLPVTMDGDLIHNTDASIVTAVNADPDVMLATLESYLGIYDHSEPVEVRFADDCFRIDNGHPVTGVEDAPILDPDAPDYRPFALSCEEQFESGYYSNFTGGSYSAYGNAELGVLFAFVRLDQPGTVMGFETPDGQIVYYPGPRGAVEGADTGEQFDGRILTNMITPMSVNGAYIFKFNEAGEIWQIYAYYRGAPLGWDAVPDE